MAERMWPDAQVTYLVNLSFDNGRYYERHRIAEAMGELDACWRPVGRKAHEQRVAERIAEMEIHAARVAEKYGRAPGYVYRGGPVNWETGAPVRHLARVA